MSTSSDARPSRRPRQVTTGAVMVIVGCSLLVLGLADTLNRLDTADTREAVQGFLREPPGSGLDVTLGQVLTLVRWYALASGALAATTLVFAVFVLRRHHGARIGLTVTATLLVLTVPVTGLLPVLVVIGALLVWSRPGREWYRGRSAARAVGRGSPLPLLEEQGPPPAPYPFGTPPGRAHPQAPGDAAPAGPGQPPPEPGSGPATGHVPVVATGHPASAAPAAHAAYAGATGFASPRGRRPWTVTTAAVLTWVGAGATLLLMLLFVLVLAAGADAFVDEFDRAARSSDVTISREQVLALGWGLAAVFLLWSIAAIVLAVLAVRGSNGARIGLSVSAGMTVLVSLLAILSMIAAITLLLGTATVVLLFTGGANEWYRGRGSAGPPNAAPYRPPFGPPGGPPHEPASWPPPSAPQAGAPPPPGRPKPW